MGITNLEEQFTFYGSYHANFLNKLIHIACVWPIFWSGMVVADLTPGFAVANPIPSLPILDTVLHKINLPVISALVYAFIYISMDHRAGSLAASMVIGCLFLARYFAANSLELFGEEAWKLALALHIFGWVAQFIGHGVFEGRSPALLDNLFQSIVAAPMFVLLEVLFPLGYRRDFQKRVEKKVAEARREFLASKKQK